MAFNETGMWEPEDDSVSNKLTGLISQNSPLMDQAKTTGMKLANRRGLQNSTMATGAATNEMIKAALPIASQEATQTHQKNLAGMDIKSKEDIALMNVAAHDRQFLVSAMTELQKKYGALFSDISKNNDLSAATRNSYYEHASALRDTDLNLLETIYGVDLDWEPAVATHV